MDVSFVEALAGIGLAAVLVEAVVTVINNAKDRYRDWRYWGSIVVGVVVAVLYGVDFFAAVGLSKGAPEIFAPIVPFVGAALTGIIISRGSNYVYDIMKLIRTNAAKIKNGVDNISG